MYLRRDRGKRKIPLTFCIRGLSSKLLLVYNGGRPFELFACRVSDPHFFCGSGSGQKSSCGSGSGSGSWGYPGEGAGGKGKKWIFCWVFFTFQMILNNGCLKSEQKKWNCLHCTSPTLQNNDLFIHFLIFLPGSGSGQGKNMRIRADPDPKPWFSCKWANTWHLIAKYLAILRIFVSSFDKNYLFQE